MNKKECLKKIVGYKNIIRIKKVLAVLKYVKAKLNHDVGMYDYDRNYFVKADVIGIEGKNVFFGYYDLNQLDKNGERALVHIVAKGAKPSDEEAVLAWIDMKDLAIHEFASTKAWSWQQGARLRWHPTENNQVMYNDYDGEKYVTIIFDLEQRNVVGTIPIPLYDIDCTGKIGLSLNFARLQRLRPGYGYSLIKDETENISAPEQDGIYLWSAQLKKKTKIIDLKELAKRSSAPEGVEHYLNHICISPSGKKFLFFHLWSYGLGSKWSMALYVANIDGSDLVCLDDTEIISHYCWLDDDTLLTTVLSNDRVSHLQYIVYSVKANKKRVVLSENLRKDGHPTYICGGDAFVSDTYPQKNCMQYVFICKGDGEQYNELLKVYANPFLIEEERCDLHPRVDERNKVIAVDTTFTGVRSVLFMKMK